MTIDLGGIDGYKTYISIALYIIYNAAVSHHWIISSPDVELFLQGAVAASFAHKVSKINNGTNVPTEVENGK